MDREVAGLRVRDGGGCGRARARRPGEMHVGD